MESPGIKASALLIPLGLALLLVLASFFSFLLFHTLAELFAIIVAILICVVAWQLYPFTRNHFLMYLGCGYFWIGVLDLMHAMTYKGMFIFATTGANVGTQFWIGTRYVEAFLLLSAPWFLSHKLNRNSVFLLYGVVAVALFVSVMTGVFPVGFVEGVGLTTFKVVSEYIIIAMLAVAIVFLVRQKALLDRRILDVMIWSISLTMCAELAFTFYVSVYDISNMVGHIFKLFSFWLIFIAMVRITLQEPFLAMLRGASAYDAIPDATVVVDDKGMLRQANNSACQLAGLPREELIGKISHDIYHPQGVSRELCPVCCARVDGKALDGLELETDKSPSKWFSFSLSEFPGISGGQATVEVVRDITGKKQAEQEFSTLSMLKDSIVENLPAMLFVKDATDLRYVEWNKFAEQLTGMSRDDMLGHGDFDFWPEEEARFFTSKDREVLKEGKLLDIPEEPLSTKSGVHTMHTKKIPIYDQQGKASYLLGISEDITERQQTELALRRSQKMDALGKLTGGIAHDYNNMLGVVLGFSELLQNSLRADPKQSEYVSEIQHAAERGVKLTRKLLSFSRQGPAEAEAVDINEIIRDEQHMLEKTLTVRVHLDLDLAEDAGQVWLDASDLEDVLLNLGINAMHAMGGEGRLLIATSNEILNETEARKLEISSGEYITLRMEDTGCGMAADVQDRIFDPFFTTKGEQGTGLGLSQVYGFVRRSGGAIKVDSESGRGTVFTLCFPRYYPKEDTVVETSGQLIEDVRGNETILIVDDEPALQILMVKVLQNAGYKVLCAGDAEQALAILNCESVDLMISDVIMPGMDGYQLAARVRQTHPTVKLQMVSGFNDFGQRDTIDDVLHQQQLTKPWRTSVLLQRVSELLG